ncbi:GNAT family N-acetyltransferase [Parvularcula lutaonensis]|uniref:GNAT family N-acetyltransferase n=1 Tax=Parvularcula lutaonensis TaxID=491923 RepID=A0ABV7M8W7_9PROT|nr:GNAT family N-acetyltransferase [Parvularcula lutaonensis]GGY45885.1 N-acetyltransferase [Parvularcula lutaonensis]
MEQVAPGAEVLRTERLILRRFRLSDTQAYFEMMNQPAVEATLIPGPASLAQAGRDIAMVEGHWPLRGFSFMAVEEKTTGLLVGRVGPWYPVGWPALEVGWTIHPRRWRRGYAAEAASAACRWIFEQKPDLDRVIHVIDPTNKGSQAVAEKIGGTNTGEPFVHPVAGKLDIWATPRSAIL